MPAAKTKNGSGSESSASGGKGKGGGRGKGGGKKGGAKGKGSGYGDGYGAGGYQGPPGGYGDYQDQGLSQEEEAFMEQMAAMQVSAPKSTEPLPEYETYLDTNTGHQRLKGGTLEIREPTAEEREKARLEEISGEGEDC